MEQDISAELTHDPAALLRSERRVSARMALEYLDREDAIAICAAILDELSSDGPAITIYDDLRDTARVWADWAHTPEIEAVVAAGLLKLGRTSLGINTRKRLFMSLWMSFPDSDHIAFLLKFGDGGEK